MSLAGYGNSTRRVAAMAGFASLPLRTSGLVSQARPKETADGLLIPYLAHAKGSDADGKLHRWILRDTALLRYYEAYQTEPPTLAPAAFGVVPSDKLDGGGLEQTVYRSEHGLFVDHNPWGRPILRENRHHVPVESSDFETFLALLAWRRELWQGHGVGGIEPGCRFWTPDSPHPFARAPVSADVAYAFMPGLYPGEYRSSREMADAGVCVVESDEVHVRHQAGLAMRRYGCIGVPGGHPILKFAVPEPRWVLSADYRGHVHLELLLERPRYAVSHRSVNNMAVMTFAADRREEAERVGREICARVGTSRLITFGKVEVYDRNCLRADHATDSLIFLMRRTAEICAEEVAGGPYSARRHSPLRELDAARGLIAVNAQMAARGRVAGGGRKLAKVVEDALFDWMPLWSKVCREIEALVVSDHRDDTRWRNHLAPLPTMFEAAMRMTPGATLPIYTEPAQTPWQRHLETYPEDAGHLSGVRRCIDYAGRLTERGGKVFYRTVVAAGEAAREFETFPDAEHRRELLEALDALVAVQPDDFPSEAAAGEWSFRIRRRLRSHAADMAAVANIISDGEESEPPQVGLS
jgi:hypothetical protein